MVSQLTAKRKKVGMASRSDGRVEKDGARKRETGQKQRESDKFPADDYLQAIPSHHGNPRPQPRFLIFSSLFIHFLPSVVNLSLLHKAASVRVEEGMAI